MANSVNRPGVKRGRKRKYSDSFQKQIAQVVISENLGLKEAALRFGLAHQTISRFTTRFYEEIVGANVIDTMKPPPEPDSEALNIVHVYEDKLRQALLKITALETMIELAEDTYKIAIRKNSGTKQPK
jgi:transposase